MLKEEILLKVQQQYEIDKAENPSYPVHICGKAAMVHAAISDLSIFAVDQKYLKQYPKEISEEAMEETAIRGIVACIRFIENLKDGKRANMVVQGPQENDTSDTLRLQSSSALLSEGITQA